MNIYEALSTLFIDWGGLILNIGNLSESTTIKKNFFFEYIVTAD